jgi:hypothetical protein
MSPGVRLMAYRHRGIVFRLDGERIVCRAPEGVLTTAETDDLRAHRAALGALLVAACRTCNATLYQSASIERGLCTTCFAEYAHPGHIAEARTEAP